MKLHITGIVLAVLCVGSSAHAQTAQAVEWKVSDGGNGHWYAIDNAPRLWGEGRTLALNQGADLASIESLAELNWLASNIPSANWSNGNCNLGGRQDSSATTPSSGWEWLSGSSVDLGMFTYSFDDNPCGIGNYAENREQDYLHAYDGSLRKIGDVNTEPFSTCNHLGHKYSSLLEWSADCNGDSIVDYGQILRGELQDDNQNGIPDVCEYTVTGVIPVSGPSSGGTPVIINGTNLPPNPTVLVGGLAATNIVRVSGTRITANTPSGLPGMTSVTVGNWVQPNAFYYRPECGSDLDQNGFVDAADIAIILLDFGQCYQTPLASPAPDVPPLLEAQPATETSRRR